MTKSTSRSTPGAEAHRSLINIRVPSNFELREEASILENLALLAHWGRHSRTGRAIWEELAKTLPALDVEQDIETLDAETIRRSVGKSERTVDASQNSNRALMVASESWQLSLGYRMERLRQAKISFTATLACIVFGVFILAAGICVSMFAVSDFRAAAFTGAVGVFIEFVGVALLWFHRLSVRRLDAEANVAHELERFRLGIALVNTIKDHESRDEALRSLIRDVRDHPSATVDGLTPIYAPTRHLSDSRSDR